MEKLLSEIYSSEINFEISTFWDGGFTVKVGDEMNGFLEESAGLENLDKVCSELLRMVLKHYPDSVFTENYNKKGSSSNEEIKKD